MFYLTGLGDEWDVNRTWLEKFCVPTDLYSNDLKWIFAPLVDMNEKSCEALDVYLMIGFSVKKYVNYKLRFLLDILLMVAKVPWFTVGTGK